jgi:hypothetical protein
MNGGRDSETSSSAQGKSATHRSSPYLEGLREILIFDQQSLGGLSRTGWLELASEVGLVREEWLSRWLAFRPSC